MRETEYKRRYTTREHLPAVRSNENAPVSVGAELALPKDEVAAAAGNSPPIVRRFGDCPLILERDLVPPRTARVQART